MIYERNLCVLLMTLCLVSSGSVSSQIDAGLMPVRIIEILDSSGLRLGTALVAGREDRGYRAGYEAWRFSEKALLGIGEQESLTLAVWAEGDWDDPWVIEALGWLPEDPAVEWSHPAAVEWTAQADSLPPVVPEGTYFGHPTLGGLTIRYAPRGGSSLTWFKLTEGAFMQLDDGAVFTREASPPPTGWWWHGPIEPSS